MAHDRESLIPEAQDELRAGPDRGTVWEHYKGGLYVVLGNAVREEDLVPMVFYQCLRTGNFWCRPQDEWHAVVSHEGKCPRRFREKDYRLDI